MTVDANELLNDYEKTAAMLAACRNTYRTLALHHRLVLQALDAATRPSGGDAPQEAPIAAVSLPACGYAYRGELVHARFAVDVYCGLVGRMWNDLPQSRPALQAALNSSVSFRKGLASSPEELFPGRAAYWRRGKYRKIAEGACLDINLSNQQKKDRLRAAARACGLDWGKDLVAFGL
jgi:hypothetical protein